MIRYFSKTCSTKDCKNKTGDFPYENEEQLKRLIGSKAYCKECANKIIEKELGIKEKKKKTPVKRKKSPAAHKKKPLDVQVYCARCHEPANRLGKANQSYLCPECEVIEKKEKEQRLANVRNFSQSSIDKYIM